MNYATPNQGLAAFFLSQGQEVLEVTKKLSKFEDKNGNKMESFFLVFNTSVEDGRTIATDFYEKRATVEPFQYYEEMKQVRELLREARNQEQESTDKES